MNTQQLTAYFQTNGFFLDQEDSGTFTAFQQITLNSPTLGQPTNFEIDFDWDGEILTFNIYELLGESRVGGPVFSSEVEPSESAIVEIQRDGKTQIEKLGTDNCTVSDNEYEELRQYIESTAESYTGPAKRPLEILALLLNSLAPEGFQEILDSCDELHSSC